MPTEDEPQGLPAYIRASLRAMAITMSALWYWASRLECKREPSPMTIYCYRHDINVNEETFGRGKRIRVMVTLEDWEGGG